MPKGNFSFPSSFPSSSPLLSTLSPRIETNKQVSSLSNSSHFLFLLSSSIFLFFTSTNRRPLVTVIDYTAFFSLFLERQLTLLIIFKQLSIEQLSNRSGDFPSLGEECYCLSQSPEHYSMWKLQNSFSASPVLCEAQVRPNQSHTHIALGFGSIRAGFALVAPPY